MVAEERKVNLRFRKYSSRVFLVLALAAIVGSILSLSCGGDEGEPSVIRQSAENQIVSVTRTTYDWNVATTIGNHSWLPLDIDGNPSDVPEIILSTLKTFEDAHPDLEVPPGSWRVEAQQRTGGYANAVSPKIFGIWVDHRPKNK